MNQVNEERQLQQSMANWIKRPKQMDVDSDQEAVQDPEQDSDLNRHSDSDSEWVGHWPERLLVHLSTVHFDLQLLL